MWAGTTRQQDMTKKTEVTFRGFKRKNWIKLDLQSAGSGDFSVSPMSKSSKISMNFSSAGDLARGLVCLWNQSMAAQDSFIWMKVYRGWEELEFS